jgi:hypothetical protein
MLLVGNQFHIINLLISLYIYIYNFFLFRQFYSELKNHVSLFYHCSKGAEAIVARNYAKGHKLFGHRCTE